MVRAGPATGLAPDAAPSSHARLARLRKKRRCGGEGSSYYIPLHERTQAMARARHAVQVETPRYERDFCLWVEEQARLLREGRLEQLDVVNLIDEIEDLGIHENTAVESNLVVVLKHLLKYQFQPRRRSRSWLSSIAEHRRRLRVEFQHSPSLRGHTREQFEQCYQDARLQAAIETGLAPNALPDIPPYTLEQALDPKFLPD
jgi:Domain of unknown function DUF29